MTEPSYDFSALSDLDLVMIRKECIDSGDIEFVRAIDAELKKRIATKRTGTEVPIGL